ncbi:HlyD family type I secretion periplasmic adaptor subunit [Polaromonas sp. YR568]|uniref:HlyD family type I secretion periplasmic adaptor subunit n=1 Tax=Polaromonas sp. YR568 TaxID=1855301 RepID=UPI003137C10D
MSESEPKTQAATPAAPTTAARELLARYKTVFAAAWEARYELAGPKRLADEAAFLPASLSLQDTPAHPAPRRLAWALMVLFVIAVTWACFGKIDIVAVAPGRIIVGDRTKVIQPLEASVVRRISVKDGDRVKAGQLLVELDPTITSADQASVVEQLNVATSEAERTTLLLNALQTGSTEETGVNGLARAKNFPSDTQRQLIAEWQDIIARKARLDAEVLRRKAEIATVNETIAKLEVVVPMAIAREADFKKLVTEGFISGHATQDKTRERVELERDLATQRARLLEARFALTESERASTAFVAETRRNLNDRHAAAASKVQQLSQDQSKASQRQRLTQLTSPVDGVVQQLAIHTAGGVVTSAQALMVIVPDSARVTAEVSIANQDIGFVYAGQKAAAKIETFPYTRYGTVPASVDIVTADAVTDEKKGSFYPATLTLENRHMNIDGKRVPLSPGMNITAEIKTGKRRVIEYLLSPIQRAGSESLRER